MELVADIFVVDIVEAVGVDAESDVDFNVDFNVDDDAGGGSYVSGWPKVELTESLDFPVSPLNKHIVHITARQLPTHIITVFEPDSSEITTKYIIAVKPIAYVVPTG